MYQEEEKCSICLDSLCKKFTHAACCGKGMHNKCRNGVRMSLEQKNRCVMCRTEYPGSDKEAVEQLRPWVEKGKAWAQYVLADRYQYGDGVDQSYQRAAELYKLSACQGDAGAQNSLGAMYSSGQSVVQSYERAAEYFEAAAQQGLAGAQSNLGNRYANGQGVVWSLEAACKWWIKAAEQGNEEAIKSLQKLDEFKGGTTPSFVPKPFECAFCYRPHDPSENKLRPCKGCHRVYYCGKECQVKHWKKEWKGHKKSCKK